MLAHLVLYTFLYLNFLVHDVAIAIFHIYESDQKIFLEITADKKDLLSEMDIVITQLNKERLSHYVGDHFSVYINDVEVKYEQYQYLEMGDHIKISAILASFCTNISSIRIENTCLIDVPDHSNIIQLDINGKSKDYRMHKGRQLIQSTFEK